MLNFDLPATKSSERRSCQFWEVHGEETHNGILAIHEDKCKRAGKAYTETSRYLVSDNGIIHGAREFLVVLDTFAGRQELKAVQSGQNRSGNVYQIRIGGYPGCDCQGYKRHHHCKHYDALTVVCDAMPDPRESGTDFGGESEPRDDWHAPAPDAMTKQTWCRYSHLTQAEFNQLKIDNPAAWREHLDECHERAANAWAESSPPEPVNCPF